MTHKSKFCADKKHPYHMSVGAVLFNEQSEVCVHKYIKDKMPNNYLHLMGDLEVGYQLMHETLEDNDSLEATALRGVKEEFGAVGKVEYYLGTAQVFIQETDHTFEKTVPYFAVSLVELGERPVDDKEYFTELEWYRPEEYIEKLKAQNKNNGLFTDSEIKIMKSFLEWYERDVDKQKRY